MSFSVGIKSTIEQDLDWQIAVLRNYPELSDKHYRPVMLVDTARTHSIVESNIPRGATGQAAKTFGSKVTGRGYTIKAQIGWFDGDDPFYVNVLEYGSRSHSIVGGSKNRTRGQRERFLSNRESGSLGAGHVFIGGSWKTVTHVAGMSARKFMASGFDTMSPQVESDLVNATEAILGEMSKR